MPNQKKKHCSHCRRQKSLRAFDKYRRYCRLCNYRISGGWDKQHKKNLYKNRLKYRHNITPEELRYLKTIQDGLCAICGEHKPLHIDHDHRCCPSEYSCIKCRRGLLCPSCNRGLGLFQDNPLLLQLAARYLKKFDKKNLGASDVHQAKD